MKRITRIMSVMLLCAFIGCGSGVPCGPIYPNGCPLFLVCTISAGQFVCERASSPVQSEITAQTRESDAAVAK